MKKLTLLFSIVFLLIFSTHAFSYEIQTLGNIPFTDTLTGISINSSTDTAVAISSETNTLYIIDTQTDTITKKISLEIIPTGIAVDAKRNHIIVSSSDGTLHFFDLETGSVSKAIHVKRHSALDAESITSIHSIAINPKTDTLYIGNSNSLMVIDLETENILKEIPLSDTPISMDIDYNLGYLLMIMNESVIARNDSDEAISKISIYNSETLGFITEINPTFPSIKRGLRGVSVNPSTHIAVLTNPSDNSISVISLSSCILNSASCISSSQLLNLSTSQLSSISLNEPSAVAINYINNTALISHKNGIAKVKLENPVPQINALIPESSNAGDSGFTLSIKGEKFVLDSKAKFDAKELTTRFQDNFSLQADVPSSQLQMPGDVPVSVINPSPGGGVSNSFIFKIYNLAPQLDYITPDTVSLKSLPATIRVYGGNFLPLSVVNLNGNNLKTKFISSILLEAEGNSSDMTSAGKYPVVVINPSPWAFTSNAVYLNVVEEGSSATVYPASDISTSELPNLSSSQLSGTGTLRGRILDTHKKPIDGVTIKIKNIKAVTDSDGYFILENVTSGKQHLMIHGETAKKPNSHHPTIPLTVNIQADITNDMPFQIYLHKQKNRNFKNINPQEDTILTDPEVPGFEMRIPKGVKIIGWDGKPNLKVSVRTVPIDRLPVKPLPSNANVRTVYMFYFHKIGGGIPDAPIPIKAKNDLELLPGEKAVLWYYDESPNEDEAPNDWAIAGTGTVTPDGKYIVSDSGVGIPKFCCGAIAWGGTSSSTEKSAPEDPNCSGPKTTAGDPVDVATGYFIHEKTDLYIPGIIPVSITRYYRSRESGSAVSGSTGLGAFGKGTYFDYDWWMGAYDGSGNINNSSPTMYLLIKPGNYQYRFPKQGDGTFINTTDPAMRGAVVTKNADNSRTLSMVDGWTYKFDSSGKLIELSDRNGNKLTFVRRSDFEGGYLTEIVTAEGNRITFNQTWIFDTFYRTDSITDSIGRVVQYIYEPDPFSSYPRLKKVLYPDGSLIEYEYDSSGRMSGIINERGIPEVFNEYDENNRVIKQTHADGGIYTFNYTVAGGNITETSMTSPNGAVTTWGFYDYANTFCGRQLSTSNFHDKYITYTITPDGAKIYERDPNTHQITKITDPLCRTIDYTYYSNGQIETVKDNLGNITRYEYEPIYGLPSKITDANLKDTTFTYTYGANNIITKVEIRDPLLKLTTVNYNTNGMPTSITDPNNNTTTFLYENTGKPAELTKIKDMLNNAYILGYDNLGRLWTVTDAKGKTTTYTYDEMNRIKEVKDPLGFITRYGYSWDGKLTVVSDAKNHDIRYEYDERSRVKKMTDQLGRVETYSYYTGAEITLTTGDNLKSITDRKGQVTTFNEYDSMNRVKKITYHDSSFTDYTYDLAGRVDYINDSVSGIIDYTYNDYGCTACGGRGMDRIAQEVTPLGTIDYTYDGVGRRKTMQVLGQSVVNYDYYNNGWLENIRQVVNGVEQKFNFTYDDGGRRERLKSFNGASLVTETVYGFDNANRLLNLEHLNPLNQILESIGYTYDPNGNRITMNRPSVTLPLPNQASNTSYNEANQMLSFNDKNIVYDNNGNMASVTNSCGTTTYTWDVRNRLVGINGFKPDCSSLTALFKYDALGRRIEKTINGVTTQYLYDGVDIIQEKQNGVVSANYIRGLNIDEPLARITQNAVRLYVTDALGSVIALTDENGAVKTTYSYDPFGNVTISGESSDNPFQFAGRENDGTGLYYYRARYYSPELQRFISEDPIGFEGGDVNLMVYVGNNPVNFVDPLGLFGIKDVIDKIIRILPKQLRDRLKLDPMPPTDVAKEIVNKEIERIKKESGPNDPRLKDLERLRDSLEKDGLPGPLESLKDLLDDKKPIDTAPCH